MKPSLKTTAIVGELAAIIFLVGWLYSEYVSNPYMRQYIDQILHSTQTGQILQRTAAIGNFLIIPLRLLALSLLSLVSIILVLLLLFMFTTFLVSVITGRARTKRAEP